MKEKERKKYHNIICFTTKTEIFFFDQKQKQKEEKKKEVMNELFKVSFKKERCERKNLVGIMQFI